MQTMSITDFKMVSPELAKVIVSTTGEFAKQEYRNALSAKLKGLGAPVDNSFRSIRKNAAVGFVRANREVKLVNSSELRAHYRVLSSASNILMDNEDRSLWEIHNGKGGSYLTRHGNEDLSSLIHASMNPVQGIPKVHQLTIGQGGISELAAYVTDYGDSDYGFIVKTNANKCLVVSKALQETRTVNNDMVTGFYHIGIDAAVNREIKKKLVAESQYTGDKATSIEYWKTLFSYAPEYADEMVSMVEESNIA